MAPYLERDTNNWRIPRDGTLSRRIYDLMTQNFKPREISKILNHNANSIRVLMHKIKHPDIYNKVPAPEGTGDA